MLTSKSTKWVNPLKRSQKVRRRKELERQKKLGIIQEDAKLELCDWKPSKLSFGGSIRVTEDSWEYKLI